MSHYLVEDLQAALHDLDVAAVEPIRVLALVANSLTEADVIIKNKVADGLRAMFDIKPIAFRQANLVDAGEVDKALVIVHASTLRADAAVVNTFLSLVGPLNIGVVLICDLPGAPPSVASLLHRVPGLVQARVVLGTTTMVSGVPFFTPMPKAKKVERALLAMFDRDWGRSDTSAAVKTRK